MEYKGGSMQMSLQDALDDVSNHLSSSARRTRALAALEQQLALACVSTTSDDTLDTFLLSQDIFESNIPSRLIAWLSSTIPRLESLTNKGQIDKDREKDISFLSGHISQSLSIIQGVVLNHQPSKHFLGRRYGLEILIDLLFASRHLPLAPPPQVSSTENINPPSTPPSKSTSPSKSTPPQVIQPHLSSTLLDTLLCILVDHPPSLRIFEDANGVQAVVKILKRAGTPREVRMKCLEFLYFYLMDESPSGAHGSLVYDSEHKSHSVPTSPTSASHTTAPPVTPSLTAMSTATTAPNTPKPNTKPRIFPRPPPGLRSGCSTSSGSGSSTSSSGSNRSTGSSTSFTSTSTSASITAKTPSPVKKSYSASSVSLHQGVPSTPVAADKKGLDSSNQRAAKPQPLQRSLLMLHRDLDYVPLSPKKPSATGSGIGEESTSMGNATPISPRKDRTRRVLTPSPYVRSRSRASSYVDSDGSTYVVGDSSSSSIQSSAFNESSSYQRTSSSNSNLSQSTLNTSSQPSSNAQTRTIEEKKAILGTLLGNVDALVDGVRRAGVWGLA
ncbi:hypothetical protein SERLA73DRAFT_79930 [Serpula lacrymans var. lacrymans S7.3]|uniref:Cell division control protein 14 n=1 Tax=Serpula lacrymans var. lacrymans (strain S7.3) TaxID=936435 RepID=F8QI39_SERL3|nr:hypothetical protein SERLA73DRAFT_79930 [Serpula lacrymans var. lacrymans S7.3]